VPVIATILMILASGTGRTSTAFGLGWVVGIILLTVVAVVVAGVAEPDPAGGTPTVRGWIRIVLGVLLLVLAWRQWAERPRRDVAEATPPP
jgi:threonine/homoserine/homoserine lactone efflux protein